MTTILLGGMLSLLFHAHLIFSSCHLWSHRQQWQFGGTYAAVSLVQ